jgi:hypothetical protein
LVTGRQDFSFDSALFARLLRKWAGQESFK